MAAGSGQSGAQTPPTPEFAATVEVVPVSGKVTFITSGAQPNRLVTAQLVPVGSTVDATNGTVELIGAAPTSGTHAGEFAGGSFIVTQPEREGGMLELALAGTVPACHAATTARAKAGRYLGVVKSDNDESVSGHSARTTPYAGHNFVRDAADSQADWTTADGCADGHIQTLVTVPKGGVAVSVSNPHTHEAVAGADVVPAGRSGCYSGTFQTTGRYAASTALGAPDATAARLSPATLRLLLKLLHRSVAKTCEGP